MICEDDSLYLDIKENLGSGRIQDYISNEARKHNIWIVAGTIPIASNKVDKVYSCCIVFNNFGDIVSSYNKIHLFDVNIVETNEKYRESDYFLDGDSIAYVDTPFGRIGLAVCYDLRFPELFRRLSSQNIDLVCMPAAFTSFTGKAHWEHLIKARAIENLIYFASSAQGGYHVSGRETYGHSMIVSPWGETLDIIKSKSGVNYFNYRYILKKILEKTSRVQSHKKH